MIHLLIAWDVAEVMGSHDDVCCTRLAVNTDTAITSTTSFARSGASPDMARGYNAVDSVTTITNLNTFHDAVIYFLTAIRVRMFFRDHFDSRNKRACSRYARRSSSSSR